MAIEKVKEYFRGFGIEDRIMEFSQSSATVELAAEAAGCGPERIAKTLSFLVDGTAVLVVMAGDARVDNKKYKEHFHTNAKMLSPRMQKPGLDMQWAVYAHSGYLRLCRCF